MKRLARVGRWRDIGIEFAAGARMRITGMVDQATQLKSTTDRSVGCVHLRPRRAAHVDRLSKKGPADAPGSERQRHHPSRHKLNLKSAPGGSYISHVRFAQL